MISLTILLHKQTNTRQQDFRFGLRGLGVRHVADLDFSTTAPKEEGEQKGGRIPFSLTLPWAPAVREKLGSLSPVEVRSGLSVKRLRGVAVPQLWRMGRVRIRRLFESG